MNVYCKITYRTSYSSNIEDVLMFDIMCGLSNIEIIERSLEQFKKGHSSNLDRIKVTKIEVYINENKK